jgi:hypothetical protein
MKLSQILRFNNTLIYLRISLMFFYLLTLSSQAYSQNELDVVTGRWLEYSDASNSLYHYLTSEAYKFLNEREDEISGIHSPEQWKERQSIIRKTLLEIVGPFPEKTPLNAKILKTIVKEEFKVEHIVYESVPGFYVTSSLYIPAGLKKRSAAPAVIYCSGHHAEGYRSDVYQHVILNLVKKGFIVFAFDPVGQGERLEYFDQKAGKSIIGGPTSEHSYPGAQAFLTGSSQARYMIWDGIRAVDYLISRKEVDPLRIGITGRSGGGTQSAYIAAFDDRIYASAPENYITSYRRLLQSIGPQDAEQNLFNILSVGLDHPDFLIVRAPKPAMMITTINDMFSIQGAMETEEEISKIYRAYGKSENFSRVTDDAGHASTVKNREAMYSFFQKHLDNPGSNKDDDIRLLTKEELRVTKTGQVSTSMGGETVFSLNSKEADILTEKLCKSRVSRGVSFNEVISAARKLSGYRDPSSSDKPVFTGRIMRKSYTIEKYFVKGEGDYIIPYLVFRPEEKGNKTMIYLHPSGKSAEASAGKEIEEFVNHGITVLAPDLIGLGETGPGDLRGDAFFSGASHNLWYASMITGRSVTGIQAGDLNKLVRLIKAGDPDTEIIGFARKQMASVLLHSAVLSGEFKSLILVESCLSFRSIVQTRFYNPHFILSSIPGVLKEYDLPDLASAFAPGKLIIANPVDANGVKIDSAGIMDLDTIKLSYSVVNSDKQLIITAGEFNYNIFFEWIK